MGFHLNNPNMSVMAVEARVKSSLLVKDHPLFKTWGAWTLAFLKDYNQRFTRESGSLYENAHYSLGVTLDWQAQANTLGKVGWELAHVALHQIDPVGQGPLAELRCATTWHCYFRRRVEAKVPQDPPALAPRARQHAHA
jgi:hypothetical protein